MELFGELPDSSNSDSSLGTGLFVELHTHSPPSIGWYIVGFHIYDNIDIGFHGYKRVEENKIWIEWFKMPQKSLFLQRFRNFSWINTNGFDLFQVLWKGQILKVLPLFSSLLWRSGFLDVLSGPSWKFYSAIKC